MIKRDLAVNEMKKALPSLRQGAAKFEGRSDDGVYLWMNKHLADENIISALALSFPESKQNEPSVYSIYCCFLRILPMRQQLVTELVAKVQETRSHEALSVDGWTILAAVNGPDLSIRVDFSQTK